MLMGMCLPKFDIYQRALASNFFKSHTNSWCPNFFQKKVSSDFRSEIHLDLTSFLPDNLFGLQKIYIYSGLPSVIFQVSIPRCAIQCLDTFQHVNINRKHNIFD